MTQINSLKAEEIDGLVTLALAEDLGSGDITTDGILVQDDVATAVIPWQSPLPWRRHPEPEYRRW